MASPPLLSAYIYLQLSVSGDVLVGVVEEFNDLLNTSMQMIPHAHCVIAVVVLRQMTFVINAASSEVTDRVKVVEGEGRRRPVALNQCAHAFNAERREPVDRTRLV